MFDWNLDVLPFDGGVNVSVVGPQLYGIGSRRVVYNKVVEAPSSYKKFFTCGDLEVPLVLIRLGVTGLEKAELV